MNPIGVLAEESLKDADNQQQQSLKRTRGNPSKILQSLGAKTDVVEFAGVTVKNIRLGLSLLDLQNPAPDEQKTLADNQVIAHH